MNICRSLRFQANLVFLVIFLLLSPFGAVCQEATPENDELFQVYSEMYFLKREANFALEMSIREAFLTRLFDSIIDEVNQRKKEDLSGTLRALQPSEFDDFDESSYALLPGINKLPANKRYFALENYQRNEFVHKFFLARQIKSHLLESGNSKQRKRMFMRDLENAFFSYRSSLFSEAALRFDELITQYGITDLADIIFYKAECLFKMNLFDRSIKEYYSILETDLDVELKRISISRLISIYGDRGNVELLLENWEKYVKISAELKDDHYWETSFLTARFLMISDETDDARDLFRQIPNSFSDYDEAQFFLAECSLKMLDFEEAENIFSNISEGNVNGGISKKFRREAYLKLGYIDFLRGDYDVAFVNFTTISGDDKIKEKAEIGAIWALYRLGRYDDALKLSTEFYNSFPNSEYIFEAQAVTGSSFEKINSDSSADDAFSHLLNYVDVIEEIRDINFERSEISESIVLLKNMEADIYQKGRKELFPQYLKIRNRFNELYNKIELFDGYNSDEEIKEMMSEQASILTTLQNQQGLKKEISDRDDMALFRDHEDVITEFLNINSQINSGIRYRLKQKNILQTEESLKASKQKQDSLAVYYSREKKKINEDLSEIKYLQKLALQNNDVKLQMELSNLELEMSFLKDQIQKSESRITKNDTIQIASQLDRWSEFANMRNIYGGLDFEKLNDQQILVESLDNYIQSLNILINNRDKIIEEEEELPFEYIPVSDPEGKPHYAPPIPMWDSASLFARVIDETAVDTITNTENKLLDDSSEGDVAPELKPEGDIDVAQPPENEVPPAEDKQLEDIEEDQKTDQENSNPEEPESVPADQLENSENPPAADSNVKPEKPEETPGNDTPTIEEQGNSSKPESIPVVEPEEPQNQEEPK